MSFRLLFLLPAVVTVSHSFGATPASDPPAGIEGTIIVSPAHGGPSRIDVPDSKPLANSTFVVQSKDRVVAEFTTDDQGHFSVAVAPGHYTVVLKGRRGGIGRFGPFEVDVAAGKTTKVEWQCDSGMR